MTAIKIKKCVLPNVPYILMFWFFAKCGEAYRLSPGRDFSHKFIGCLQGLNSIFSQPMLAINPFDLGIGIAGALAVYLAVLYKNVNPQKFLYGYTMEIEIGI